MEPEINIAPIDPIVVVQNVPMWLLVLAGIAVALLLVVLGILLGLWWRKAHEVKPLTPGEKALQGLGGLEASVAQSEPLDFSVGVSDVLRHYVSEKLSLPATSQTSPEFLAAVADHPRFSAEERELLKRFLEKADLIKFARVPAGEADSRELLSQARQFVRGKEEEAA